MATPVAADNILRLDKQYTSLESLHLIPANVTEADFGGHLSQTLIIPPVTYPPSNVLVTGSANNYTEFNFTNTPGFESKDGHSIFLCFKVSESGGINSVTPSFVESFLDRTTAVEWYEQNQKIGESISMAHIALMPALQMDDTPYTSICNVMNHSSSLLYSSSTAIAANGTALYGCPLYVPFPDGEPFWFGAFKNLTCRIRLQNAVNSGTGTLTLASDGIFIMCFGKTVPSSEYAAYEAAYSMRRWKKEQSMWIEFQSINIDATAESGTGILQLQALTDVSVPYMILVPHLSRSNTGNAFFDILAPTSDYATAYIVDKAGNILFSSTGDYIKFLRYVSGAQQVGLSKFLQNRPYILISPTDDMQKRFHLGMESSKYRFQGTEQLRLKGWGTTVNNVFVDVLAVTEAYWELNNKSLRRISV